MDHPSSGSESSSTYSLSRASSPEAKIPRTVTFIRLDDTFKTAFESLIRRWQSGIQTQADRRLLQNSLFSIADYHSLTDTLNLRHGIEFVGNKIVLYEAATAVSEYMGGVCDDWIINAYGSRHLYKLRSASMLILDHS